MSAMSIPSPARTPTRSVDVADQEKPSPTKGRVAHIVSVAGAQAIALVEQPVSQGGASSDYRIEMGALMKILTSRSLVFGVVSAISCPAPENSSNDGAQDLEFVELNLAGEIAIDAYSQDGIFQRGVASLPSVGDAVYFATPEDLQRVYSIPQAPTIDVGHLFQSSEVPARLLVNDLLGKHFLVVGTTGCGKSSAVSCILQSVLQDHPYARVLVLDVHNEYASAFGKRAELVGPDNLCLPFWMMTFDELTAALTDDDEHRAVEVEILGEAVLSAKRRYSEGQSHRLRRNPDSAGISVDTPTPFRLSDVTEFIDERLGSLERMQAFVPLKRLRNRIELLVRDPRYSFMFGNIVVEDTMRTVLSRLFRVPTDGKPITVVNLASVPPGILDIVISLISRLAFDFGVWSGGSMPMLIVCEEAHRYAPTTVQDKFVPTRKALAAIAKEGRKYGVSLALITQRPSELDQTILSQCSTVIAMRLATETDQQVVRANTHEGAIDLLEFLPLLGDREAIILGQGVVMPMRIKFRDLGPTKCSGVTKQDFSSAWKNPVTKIEVLDEIVRSWRQGGRQEQTKLPRADDPKPLVNRSS